MSNISTLSSRLARAVQLVVFSTVSVALAAVCWRCTDMRLPNVGQFAGIAGSAFLGGVLNPIKDVGVAENAAQSLRTKFDWLWLAAVGVGGAAIIVGALALAIHGERHVNAASALAVLATAFGGLFLDTSKITHVPDPAVTSSMASGGSGSGGSAGH
ncbi:MAG: hypothetical protein HOW97_27530 [Catenulispora sp.]|nr:hypothetical protein [Catenulispora sp.]